MLRALFLLLFISLLTGCESLKKTLVLAGLTGTSAAVGSAMYGPIGAGVSALSTATVVGLAQGARGDPVKETVAGCPDQITSGWGLLGQLIETAGLWVGLFFLITALVPLILGYLLPGPLERKAKKKR
jgi:hypothetical protein